MVQKITFVFGIQLVKAVSEKVDFLLDEPSSEILSLGLKTNKQDVRKTTTSM